MRADLVSELASIDADVATTAAAFQPLSPAQLGARPGADEWSRAQVVHHMADSGMVNAIRTRLLLTQPKPRFGGYDERLWTALADADQPAVADSFAILQSVHARWATLLPALSDADWARALTHSATEQVSTLAQIMEHYVDHARLHLAQLQALQDEPLAVQAAAYPMDGENAVTNEERAALIAKIDALPQQLADLVAPLSQEQLLARPLAGEWSVAQNVHHLADSHMTSFIRVKLMLTQENPAFTPYSPDAYADLPDASKAEIDDSLALLRGLHARWVLLWQSLSEAQWARTGFHPETGRTYTLDDILRTYGNHGEAHLDQIGRTLAAQHA